MTFLNDAKGYILHYAIIGIAFLDPSVQAYFASHQLYAMVGLALWGSLLHYANGKLTAAPAKLAMVALCLLVAGGMVGCNATNAAETAAKIIDGIVNIVKVDVPALPPNDVAIATPWANLLVTLDAQLDTCVSQAASAGGKKATFLVCFNTFAAGATNPNELAQLRVMSPVSQSKAELWATAIILGVNAAVTEWGGQPQPIPVVTSTPASSASLHQLRVRLGIA